jgi:3-methylcrotonyl-CoA carboxylase alpha subunit
VIEHQIVQAARPWTSSSGFRLNRSPSLAARLIDQSGTVHEFERGDGIDPAFVSRREEWAIVPELGATFAFRPYAVRSSNLGTAGDGAILAPMPGRITAVEVAAGETVTKGQRLVTLEAMKMEHGMTAPFDGVVAGLNVTAGAQVSEGALLVRIKKAEA